MTLEIETLTHACNAISQQVKDDFRELTLHYIVHHEGQRAEALALAGQEVMHHPAADTAMGLLKKNRPGHDSSSMIGIAVARETFFLGMASRHSILGLFSMNANLYDSIRNARRHAWHMAWHAIDALHFHHHRADNKSAGGELIVRKRNGLEMAASNLKADVFAATISALQGDYDAIKHLAVGRGMEALTPVPEHNPEQYPFVIAMESANLVMEQLRKKTVSKKKTLELALKVADDIGKTFDYNELEHWFEFCEPAQDMAWRHYDPPHIISAAINTSENTHVRALGYLVSETTGVTPASAMNARGNYSPFADDMLNKRLHEKAIEETFEHAIALGIKNSSIDPFMEAANAQNLKLTEGQVMGWCASALQAAGFAFDKALKTGEGKGAEQAARKEFAQEKGKTTWETLRQLGSDIINYYRHGVPLTLNNMLELCKGKQPAAQVSQAIKMTLKDPAWQKQLESAASLSEKPLPKMPAPEAARRMAARPGVAPAAPGMGPGRGGAQTQVKTRSTVPPPDDALDIDTGDDRNAAGGE